MVDEVLRRHSRGWQLSHRSRRAVFVGPRPARSPRSNQSVRNCCDSYAGARLRKWRACSGEGSACLGEPGAHRADLWGQREPRRNTGRLDYRRIARWHTRVRDTSPATASRTCKTAPGVEFHTATPFAAASRRTQAGPPPRKPGCSRLSLTNKTATQGVIRQAAVLVYWTD